MAEITFEGSDPQVAEARQAEEARLTELGEKIIEICVAILEKAVALTETDMDDELLEVVKKAIAKREEA